MPRLIEPLGQTSGAQVFAVNLVKLTEKQTRNEQLSIVMEMYSYKNVFTCR